MRNLEQLGRVKIHLLILLLAYVGIQQSLSAQSSKRWKLVWEENFDAKEIDYSTWSKIPRATSDWNNTMSDDNRLFALRDGKLILKGIVNDDKTTDKSDYLTGGLWTSGKKAFMGGKIEVRAKLNSGQGAWPAIWLMPFNQKKTWPLEGEIDIMEHLNYDNFVYQTVHSNYTQNLGGKAGSHQTSSFNSNEFNTFGVEIQEEKLNFYVNGIKTFEYKRDPSLDSKGQFPFYREMHLILSMQLGGGWVGQVNPSNLPLEMEVDWIRHYQKETIKDSGDYPNWNEVDYPRETNSRVVQSLSIKGAEVNGNPINFKTIVAGENANTQNKIVFDNTADVLEASTGNELTLEPKVKNLSWMHYYLYIDYNQNKKFDDDELVSYSVMQKDGKYVNSKGEEVSLGDVPKQMPSFTIPQTAKLGKTRARFKVDWDNISPKGNMNPTNLLSKNGGTVCDFTINILKGENTVSIANLGERKAIVITPNPSSSIFEVKGLDVASISIYDMNACLVKSFSSNQKYYSVENLPNGVYILSITTTKGKRHHQQLIIRH